MLYKYDKTTLNYKKVTGTWLLIVVCAILVTIAITSIIAINRVNDIRFISEETKAIILREADKQNEFSREKLKAYILELNVKYPHIVMAQAELETGGFKSAIFKENHNLFGLKQAKKRPTTNKENDTSYGKYDNWRSSVVDYAFLQSTFIYKINNEDEYFEYLKQFYAEDINYIYKLKKIISENSF